MSRDIVRSWLEDEYEFPMDNERGIYHSQSLIHARDIIKSLEQFLAVMDDHAFQFFFETANKYEIDVFSYMDGVFRPATREGSKRILGYCCEWGTEIDWQLHWINLEDMPCLMFHTEQINKIVNEEVKGLTHPFSIPNLLVTNASRHPTADRPLGERERKTLLKIIAALAIELKIPLNNSSKAGEVIATLTDKIGASVDHETIARKLKKIPDLLEKLPN